MILADIISIIAPAIAVGVMIIITHMLLGIEILKRGVIFIDLAIAQSVGFGLILAEMLNIHTPYISQLVALSSAIIAGLFFRRIERILPQHQEAIIGIFYVLMATLSLLLLSLHASGAEHFKGILSGEILFVSWEGILLHLPIYMTVIILWQYMPILRRKMGFYVIFAITITSSVQLVGVFMVFTLLIVPALMIAISNRSKIYGYLATITGLALGLMLSVATDLPSSSCIILMVIISNILMPVIFRAKML